MILLRLLGILIVVGILVVFFSQIVVPLWNNEPLFPFLRQRRRNAEKRLQRVQATIADTAVEAQAKKLEKTLEEQQPTKE